MAENGKRTNAAAWAWNERKATVTWTDGQVSHVDVNAMSAAILESGLLYGIEQKLRDAYALPAKEVEVDGKKRTVYPTVAEKREAFQSVLDALNAGTWNQPRGEGEVRSYVFMAMQRLYAAKGRDYTREEFDATTKKLAEAQGVKLTAIFESLRRDERIAAEIEKIRAERGVKTADVSGLVDDLENL